MIEIWKDIEGYENYMVSSFGTVHSKKRKIDMETRITSCGYVEVGLRNKGPRKSFLMHRLVALAFLDNKEEKACVDHINRDKTDNNVLNLRFATRSENNGNREKKALGTTSKYKGVSKTKHNSWKTHFKINGKSFQKCFKTELEAVEFYNQLAFQHFGEFAHLNVVNE